MIALIRKELSGFFSSSIGYLVIGGFLLVNGLFLWLIKGPYNLIDNGFADLQPFFDLAPWVLLFLISAVSMRMISEEVKQGTIEILSTKPISTMKMVWSKFFSALILVLLALVPTLIYVFSINQLGNPPGNLDTGSTIGSYIGMIALAGSFCGIGIFASSLSQNQIVAFILSVLLSLLFYLGFDSLADLFSDELFSKLGLNYHYRSVSQGVLDSRDLIYFISFAFLFVLLTGWKTSFWSNKPGKKWWLPIIIIGFILINVLAGLAYARFDMTEEKRFTLNAATKDLVDDIESPLIIDVFLEGDDFPSEFRRLRSETNQLLEEFSSLNPMLKFNFINPIAEESSRDRNIQQLSERGMNPMQLSVQEAGSIKQSVVFPWALASYEDLTVIIPLIKNKLGSNQEEMVNSSIQQLEYAFADGFNKLIYPKRKKIAVLRGNGQLPNRNIADFITELRSSYFIAPFTLDSVEVDPGKSLEQLKEFDLIINAKPKVPFSEKEKLVLDQYIMSGGKSLWLLEKTAIDMDSLNNESGSAVAVPIDLNLTDMFFKYGFRINPVLVNDLYSAPITLATGEGSESRLNRLPWFYAPLSNTEGSDHPIVKNLNLIKFDFSNPIDTLKNNIDKYILLQSSVLSKLDGTPREVSLSMATREPDPKSYQAGQQTMGLLLEGQFKSTYANRILPEEIDNFKSEGIPTAMIVVSDGDIIKNEVRQNQAVELGFDPQTGDLYGNKEFLLNAVNYLLDEKGLIDIRSKDISLAFLDQAKAAEERLKYQLINILSPLLILGLFLYLFSYLRRKKYG